MLRTSVGTHWEKERMLGVSETADHPDDARRVLVVWNSDAVCPPLKWRTVGNRHFLYAWSRSGFQKGLMGPLGVRNMKLPDLLLWYLLGLIPSYT